MSREELIEKMRQAQGEVFDADGFFSDDDPKLVALSQRAMAAALDVAVGELLGDCTEDEWIDHELTMTDCGRPRAGIVRESLKDLFSSRRSRYLPKSAEDRMRESVLDILRKWADADDNNGYNEESAETITERVLGAIKGAN